MKKLLCSALLIGLLSLSVFAKSQDTQVSSAALTTPNATTDTFETKGFLNHTFIYTIAGVSNNIVLRPQGSRDGTNWFHLDDSEADSTFTANGTYIDHKANFTLHKARILFVSESGATTATGNVTYTGGGRGR